MKWLAALCLLPLIACRPVAVCPEPPVLPPPVLLFDALPDGVTGADVVVALVLDHNTLKAETAKRDALLNAYRKPKKEKAK